MRNSLHRTVYADYGAQAMWTTCVLHFPRFQNETNRYAVMVAETISLGVLSLPAAVATLGLVP